MNCNNDLNLYKKFYLVAKNGTFVKAAKEMFCTQPALSVAVKQLEEILNTKLMYRTSSGIRLTNAGKELYKYIEEAMNLISVAERKISENSDMTKGEISIGIQSHLAQFFLFPYIKEFNKKFPDIKINIRSRSTQELLKELQDNKVDFVIDTSPIDSIYNNLVIQELLELDNCFISYKKEDIHKLEDLVDKKLILPVDKGTSRKELDKFFEDRNLKIDPYMTIETTVDLKNAVKGKMGIGYIIEIGAKEEIDEEKLYKIELDEELPKWKLNLIYIEKYLTDVPKKFIDMINEDYNK